MKVFQLIACSSPTGECTFQYIWGIDSSHRTNEVEPRHKSEGPWGSWGRRLGWGNQQTKAANSHPQTAETKGGKSKSKVYSYSLLCITLNCISINFDPQSDQLGHQFLNNHCFIVRVLTTLTLLYLFHRKPDFFLHPVMDLLTVSKCVIYLYLHASSTFKVFMYMYTSEI